MPRMQDWRHGEHSHVPRGLGVRLVKRYLLNSASIVLFSFFVSANAIGGVFGPSNLQECLLDNLPGAGNDAVAGEIANKCSREYGVNGRIERKHGFLAPYHSGSECTLAKARNTPSLFAARVIQINCYILYEPFDPSTAVPVEPEK